MDKTICAIWDAAIVAVKKLQKQSEKIVLYSDSEKVFKENFNYYYSTISEKFMAEENENGTLNRDGKTHLLDRHKTAAIIICSILKTNVLGVGQNFIKDVAGKEFLGNEKIAFELALSYMYTELKRDFAEGKVPYEKLFDKYIFPIPYSCSRPYGESICRDLCFSAPLFDLNPLLLANLMFFIEDYSFAVSGIRRTR